MNRTGIWINKYNIQLINSKHCRTNLHAKFETQFQLNITNNKDEQFKRVMIECQFIYYQNNLYHAGILHQTKTLYNCYQLMQLII